MFCDVNCLAAALLTAQSVHKELKIILKNSVEVVSLCCVLGLLLFLSRLMFTIVAEPINLLEKANECSLVSISCLIPKVLEKDYA